jgi:hypothetical protein
MLARDSQTRANNFFTIRMPEGILLGRGYDLQVSDENLLHTKKGNEIKKGDIFMSEIRKIRHLLNYWMSHNENHTESFMRWAAWASDEGNEELSRILVRLHLESKRLNRLFEAAKKVSS